jgi:hypothetical protein
MGNFPQALGKSPQSPQSPLAILAAIWIWGPGIKVALHSAQGGRDMLALATTTSSSSSSRSRETFDRMERIIRAEFIEMPGMRLTRGQFRRLWNLNDGDCDRLVRRLIGAGFLVESRDGIGRPPDH